MSGDPYSPFLTTPRAMRINGHLSGATTIINSDNFHMRNQFPQFMMTPQRGSLNQQMPASNRYMPFQPMMQSDISTFSPTELYNLECARRLEAEQLAARRRQLECLQSYRTLLQKCPIDMNPAPRFAPLITESISPELPVNEPQPPFLSTNGVDGSLSKSPLSCSDKDDISNSPTDFNYRSSVSPPDEMQMPPLTRIIDVESTGDDEEDKTPEPSAKKATKVRCTICGENAICKSYGAVCCDSCRLFFRRTIVKEAHKSYACSAKKKCIVTGRHRSRCQFCRFQRCLMNGMKPEYVLKNCNDKNITSADLMHSTSRPARTATPSCEVSLINIPRYNESLTNSEAFDVHGVVLQYEKMRCNMTPAPLSQITTIITTFKDLLSAYLRANLFTTPSSMDMEVIKLLQNDSLTGALMLRMAYYYDPVVHGLPHCRLFAPTDAIQASGEQHRMIPMSLYDDILKTLKSIHLLKIDNTIICLLILVYISQTDSTFDFYMSGADDVIDKFTLLLKKYIASVHGPLKASELFPKLLMKLIDIKELQIRLDKYVMPSSSAL